MRSVLFYVRVFEMINPKIVVDGKPARIIKVGRHKIMVDAEDYPFLSRYSWSVYKDKRTYYARSNAWLGNKNTVLAMHRLIAGLRKAPIDHKNRNGLDNRKVNLRYCSPSQNSYNRVRENKYGFRGVYMPNGSSRFAFQIQVNGKRIARYGFKTAIEAAQAYDKANKELHGEFGIRNFKD